MSEFSLKGYCELLSRFRDVGYSFRRFRDINSLKQDNPYVVLRHDVDIDLRLALELAHIEHEEGVRSTYFVLTRSPFYSVLSSSSAQIIQQIFELGHDLAAHVYLKHYNGNFAQALLEIDTLAEYYPYIDTQIVSLHCPGNLGQLGIDSFKCIDNTYGPILRGEMAYMSDSTGRWRYGHPLASRAFHDRKPIQLLTHPIWWIQDGGTPLQKLQKRLERFPEASLMAAKEFLPALSRESGE